MTDTAISGVKLYKLIERLYPFCRSITGNGVRQSLQVLKEIIPLEIHEVPSVTKVFDWTVPDDWNIRDGYIRTISGETVIVLKISDYPLTLIPLRFTIS